MRLSDRFPDGSVCVLGLGYVGLTLAVTMADVGLDVLGVEIRDDILESLRQGQPHFHEPGLAEKLQRTIRNGRLQVAKRVPARCGARVYIITVGTPLAEGRARLDMIEAVTGEVAGELKHGDMVIVRSTVKLGTTRSVIAPLLDRSDVRYDLAFCPERTLEGRALTELRQLPQIVGGATLDASVRAGQLFQFLTPTVVRVSDPETAEMIKLIDNAQRDVSFAYANEVARACDAIGISAAEVIRAGKLGYPRTSLPMPGLVGGPCLEKDSHILAEGLRAYGIEPEITVAARTINERQPSEIVRYLRALCTELDGFHRQPNIALLGLAFKGQPATGDLRGTMARPILAGLKREFPGATFRGFDAVVPLEEIVRFGLHPCSTLEEAFKQADLAVILNNHALFQSMTLAHVARDMRTPGLVYDFWNCFDPKDLHLPEGVGYVALGAHGCAVLPVAKDRRVAARVLEAAT
jgi:UDP-N-acetyl-D-mannosaminuronic acid dehydrogenase